MQSTTERTLVGVFDSNEQAQAACKALRDAGIAEDRVHVKSGNMADALSDSSASVRKDDTSYNSSSDAQDPPGFFARLFGAADAEPEHIQQYSEAVRRGSCVVVVDSISEDRVKAASDVLARCGAVDIDERAAKWRERGWQGYDETAPQLSDAEIEQERASYGSARSADRKVEEGTTRIPVVEEQMKVGKREVQGGGVRVYTRTTERPVEENVTLRQERAYVERRPVDREATEADLGNAFKEGSIELRETSEEAVISKTARVVEEVDVSKEKSERTETVRDTVRRSDVEVEDLPGSRTQAADKTSGTRKGKNS